MRVISLITLLFILNTAVSAQVVTDTLTYTVKQGDYLTKISKVLGDVNFTGHLFDANRDKIEDPNLIYPGQKLLIPISVRSSSKFVYKLEYKPKYKSGQDSLKILTEFREAFKKTVENQNKEKADPESPDAGLGLGGLIINQTRSKMGNDFYNVFYEYWQTPKEAGNFILTITEQPIPSLGTLVIVNIDYEQVFQAKLQPRYDVIEQLAKQAVFFSYQHLHQKISTSSQLKSY